MIKTEKKFPSIRKNDPQNAIVIVGIWICVATVAIIIILNFTAKQKKSSEPRVEVKQTEKILHPGKLNYTKYSQAGIAMTKINSIKNK